MKFNKTEILLVEDNDDEARLIKTVLKTINRANDLVHLTNGLDALEFVFAAGKFEDVRSMDYPPRIILLDIGLPRFTGLEVLQHLKSSLPTKAIPVIILTNSSDEADVQKCYNLGANSYILKPVDYTEFKKTLSLTCDYWLRVNHAPTLRQLYLA